VDEMNRKPLLFTGVAMIVFFLIFDMSLLIAQNTETLPGIVYNVTENIFNEIGPALPAIVEPGSVMQLTLTQSYAGLSVTRAYLVTVKLSNNNFVYLNYSLGIDRAGVDRYNFTLPLGVEDGLYDLIVESETKTFQIKRSVWVVSQWPSELKIAVMTDLHFITGTPNTLTGDINRVSAFTLAGVLNPDLIFWLGDIADQASPGEYYAAQTYRYSLLYRYPILGIPGNHDAPDSNYRKYLGPSYWYRILGSKLLVVGLFSAEGGTPTWEQIVFLEEVLSNYSYIPYKAILVHHPMFYYQGELYTWYNDTETLKPYSQGVQTPVSSYWSNNMTAFRYVLKLIEDYNVTFVLSGHVHRDFYVKYTSVRTNTTTLFMTITTTAHGTASYDAIGFFKFNLETGDISFPIKPPTFIGFQNSSTPLALNSIPIGIYPPANNLGWANKTYFPVILALSNNAYTISLSNNLEWLNISGELFWVLPWNGSSVSYKVTPENPPGLEVNTYWRNNLLYLSLKLEVKYGDSIELVLYNAPDNDPPDIIVSSYTPRPPYLNRTFTLYLRGIDIKWGVRSASFVLVDGSNVSSLTYTQTPNTFTQKLNNISYTLQFTIVSTTAKSVLLNATITDYYGRTRVKVFNITFIPYGAQPPANPIIVVSDIVVEPETPTTTTEPTTSPSTTTTTTTTTETWTPTTTGTTITETTTTTSPFTTTEVQPPSQQERDYTLVGLIIVVLIVIVAVIYVFFLRK
jgi:predicted MPP superfamily phosphohydrolase